MKNYHKFTAEFLEPFSEGTCSKHANCLACMLDALCAWCDLDRTCVLRNVSDDESLCTEKDSTKMLVTDGSVCPVCDDHVDCVSCAQVCTDVLQKQGYSKYHMSLLMTKPPALVAQLDACLTGDRRDGLTPAGLATFFRGV